MMLWRWNVAWPPDEFGALNRCTTPTRAGFLFRPSDQSDGVGGMTPWCVGCVAQEGLDPARLRAYNHVCHTGECSYWRTTVTWHHVPHGVGVRIPSFPFDVWLFLIWNIVHTARVAACPGTLYAATWVRTRERCPLLPSTISRRNVVGRAILRTRVWRRLRPLCAGS